MIIVIEFNRIVDLIIVIELNRETSADSHPYLLYSVLCMFVCSDGSVIEPDMSAGFCPDHKAAMVLFLDRVYGIEDQNFLLHLLEVGFLPDLRAAASLDTVSHVTPISCRSLTSPLIPCDLWPPGGSERDRHGAGSEPVPVHGGAAAAH